MPVLGFGVYQIPAEQTEQVVSDATFSRCRAGNIAALGAQDPKSVV